MRFTIEGFSQQRAVELNLTAEDLVILRWFVDFWPSPNMVKMQHDGKTYALVNYSGFIEQMPIIGCNKRTIARKFQRLVEADVLENVTIKQGGSFSVYRFGTNYDSLVQKSDTVVQTCAEGCTKNDNPMDENVQPPMYKNEHTKTKTFNSTNQLDSSNNISMGAKAPRSAMPRFTPPSLDDVKAYCLERHNGIDPERFIDFYASKGWMVGKNKMKDWKAAVRNWERGSNNEVKKEEKHDVRKDGFHGWHAHNRLDDFDCD